MFTATPESQSPSIGPLPANPTERVIDACRHAAHFSHEARLLKSIAQDAVEDGMYAAKRTFKTVRRRADDLKDLAVFQVKRRPLQAVGLGVGLGVLVGFAAGWIALRPCRRV